jgi:hypothetical protein
MFAAALSWNDRKRGTRRVARGSTLSKDSLRSAFRLEHHPFKAANPRELKKISILFSRCPQIIGFSSNPLSKLLLLTRINT